MAAGDCYFISSMRTGTDAVAIIHIAACDCDGAAGDGHIGILCAYVYQRLMVTISQGTMRDIRLEIFSHMESLPIRYFDTRAHGDIMSVYTNDVDTLRQVISQSIPQMINSIVTLVITFAAMFLLYVPLTLVTLVMV